MNDRRPDPDELLRQIQAEQAVFAHLPIELLRNPARVLPHAIHVEQNQVRIDGGNEGVTARFTNDDVDYRFCNMDMMTLAGGFTFPFVPTMSSEETQPEDWMTEEQIISTTFSPR